MKKRAGQEPPTRTRGTDASTVAVEDVRPSLVVVADEAPGSTARPMTGNPVFTLSQAATACAASRGMLRRALDAGRFPNAYKAGDGVWRIPVDDLGSAGFDPRRWEAVELERREELRLEVDRLRAANELLRELLTATETVARERQERIDDLQFALRMLPEAWAQKLKGSGGSALGPGWTGSAEAEDAGPAEGPSAATTTQEAPISRFGAALHALWDSRDGPPDPEINQAGDDLPVGDDPTTGESDPRAARPPERPRRWRWRLWHRGDRRRP
jgi:hypothetical protein